MERWVGLDWDMRRECLENARYDEVIRANFDKVFPVEPGWIISRVREAPWRKSAACCVWGAFFSEAAPRCLTGSQAYEKAGCAGSCVLAKWCPAGTSTAFPPSAGEIS